jgi:tRNA threonylcarbamoyladenosine biosynthesis protein TsaB
MNILCVDTATRNNWVGLYQDNKITDCIGYEDRQSCLINLIPSIELLLKNAQIELPDLDGVVTVVGPGAWSSLRIGLTTVKQLCLVNQLPLTTMSSLDLIVEAARRENVGQSHILAVMNAQSGKVYSALYRINDEHIDQTSPYLWDDVPATISNVAASVDDLQIVGDGVELFERYLRRGWQTNLLIPQNNSRYLSILGEIATQRQSTYQHEEILLLKPLYIQPSSAEVEFKVSVT